MTDRNNPLNRYPGKWTLHRRQFLKEAALAGLLSAAPPHGMRKTFAAQQRAWNNPRVEYPDWIAEARIYGMSVSGARMDLRQLKIELDRAVRQKANVIEADSRLSDYQSEDDFATELRIIERITDRIHERDLKVVWYIPSLEVITPNGRNLKDSFARIHRDWLQLAFDGETRGVFFGQKVFWVEKNDESAWLCPHSPFREWIKARLRRLAQTGVDGIWLDVPLFDTAMAIWGCACHYCREQFERQTGLGFPDTFDVSNPRFWRYIQWRHEVITAFIEDCQKAITSVNQKAITITEVVSLDHLGATMHGLEGSSLANNFVVWETDTISETTSMAEASYEDWIILHNIYKYCRGATMDRPSWAFCYGYDDHDAQLVMASAVAAQNNPYETRIPKMTTSVGEEYRAMMYNWIAEYSKQIFRSDSLAPVAVLYSERNRDFLDATRSGGIFYSTSAPRRDQKWIQKKPQSVLHLKYMADYRGLSLFLYQHQIPTDIYPMSRVNTELLQRYKVLVLPYMAILTRDEKELLLQAVRDGATLIVSGTDPGRWDADGRPRTRSLWDSFPNVKKDEYTTHSIGKGRLYFWKKLVGRDYLRDRDKQIATPLLSWLYQAGAEPWINKKTPVVIQPYVLGKQVVIHVLNYSWVGGIKNEPRRLPLELSIPWDSGRRIEKIIQSEPSWNGTKTLAFLKRGNQIRIPLNVGIHALVIIHMR